MQLETVCGKDMGGDLSDLDGHGSKCNSPWKLSEGCIVQSSTSYEDA